MRRLVRNYRDFKVAVEHARFPTPSGGYINASTVVVRRERLAVLSASLMIPQGLKIHRPGEIIDGQGGTLVKERANRAAAAFCGSPSWRAMKLHQ